MSDLQCPARLLLVRAPDGAQPHWERLGDARVLAVYAEPGLRADAEQAAGALDATVHVLDAPAGTWHTLTELADLHRGESVLVVLTQDRLADLLARLGAPIPPAGEPVRVDVDGDGIQVVAGT